ncbi:adenylylsulfate kinase [Proteiniborus sp. DW1]|uniref:adenylyl-sulfate kinase n=1 Tax=Proteiniborus sp. DW1 TaxID=1889883 RepID=UPI00092DFE1F|nr:adenylyl-sulfate kinase [Proteiniborus sp. DW1]SCG81930.1 adenylylsulfate kinase [Proteiniborus sp. DW1]
MVIWIIGMSGSGKTTLGNEMYKILKSMNKDWVILDGDMVRASLGEDLGHSIEDRRKNAYRISNLCKLLDAQGINVIACVLSIFHDNQKYNREIFSCYKEIFLDVKFEKLIERDNKGLYQNALNGNIKNFVGVDIEFIKPYAPDIVIDNNEDNLDFSDLAFKIINELGIENDYLYEYASKDRLKYPEKYQYTKFIGTPFLESYMTSRDKSIKILEKAVVRIVNNDLDIKTKENDISDFLLSDIRNVIPHIEKEIEFSPEKIYRNGGEITTKHYLLNILKTMSNGNLTEDMVYNIQKLLNRFEVTKRIYAEYNKNFKRSSLIYDEMINYLLFLNILLLLLSRESSKSRKYILFNTILKLNDLVTSSLSRVFSKSEIILAYCGLVKEKEIFESLWEEQLC